MSLSRLFIPLVALLSLVSHPHLVQADDPIPLLDGQPAQYLLAPNSTAYFSYTPTAPSTDNSLYIGLSKDSFDGTLVLYLSQPDQPVNATGFKFRLPLADGTDSSSSTLSIQPGNYTLLLVNEDSLNNITATIVLSTRPVIAVPNTEPVAGSCMADGPLYYSVDVPSPINNDVILYIQPSNRQSLQYEHGLSLFITYGHPSPTNATWSYSTLYWNETAAIEQDDPRLLSCPSPCTLYLVIDCVVYQAGVQYRLTTQEALGLLTVQPNVWLPAIQATAPKHYQLFVARPPTLYISIEPCEGELSAYLSTTSMYPSTPDDSVLYWTRPNSAPIFTLGAGALANYTEYQAQLTLSSAILLALDLYLWASHSVRPC